MKTKQMIEAAVWKSLAKLWDQAVAYEEGNAHVLIDGQPYWGLCCCIDSLSIEKTIKDAMRKRLRADGPRRGLKSGYFWPITLAGAAKRAAFCKRMARACQGKKKKARAVVES